MAGGLLRLSTPLGFGWDSGMVTNASPPGDTTAGRRPLEQASRC
jgi:hypothetical protein